MIGAEIEQLLRRLIREELGRALVGEAARPEPEPDDEADLRELAAEHAAKLRRSQGDR